MASRTVITLGALIALGFGTVMAVRIVSSMSDEPRRVVNTSASAVALSSETPPPRAQDPAPAAPKPATVEVAPVDASLGEAEGNIHFSRVPAKQGDGAPVRIDLQVRSALGVWQPGQNTMRILLMEAAPASEQIAKLVDAVQSGSLDELGARRAIIELRFVPGAQAFDRNELDSATLIASDGKLSSTADALAGLDWAGSLPSPQLVLPPGSERPTVELTSGGNTETADRTTWKQKWHLSLAVPVVMSPISNQ